VAAEEIGRWRKLVVNGVVVVFVVVVVVVVVVVYVSLKSFFMFL
jgi:hypothetical protein